MPLTQDQAKSLLTKAKERNPDLTRDQAKLLLSEANRRVPNTQPQDNRSTPQKIADFLGLSTLARGAQAAGSLLVEAVSPDVAQARVAQQQAEQLRQQVAQRARTETNPELQQLLQRSVLSGGENLANISQQQATEFAQNAGISPQEQQIGLGEFIGRRAAGSLAEAGSYLIPGGSASTAGARITQAAGRGALVGGLQGLAGATREAETLGEGITQTSLGALVGAGTGAALQTGTEGLRLGLKIPEKVGKLRKNVSGKVLQQQKDDVIRSVNPNKAIRKAASERGIDIGEEFIFGDYGDDITKNIDIADRKLTESSTKFNKILQKNQSKFNFSEIIDDIANEQLDKARTTAQKEAIKRWAIDQQQNAIQKYGSNNINTTALLQEKILAGQSGYKGIGPDVVQNTIGQADASLERSIRSKILDSVGSAEKLRLEKLLREQEKAIFMKLLNSEALISKLPRSTAQKIGSLFFPSSLARETIGSAAEFGVSKIPTTQTTQQSGLVNLLNNIGRINTVSGISQAAQRVQPVETIVNPAIAAMNRALENENKRRTNTNRLP